MFSLGILIIVIGGFIFTQSRSDDKTWIGVMLVGLVLMIGAKS